MITNKLSAPIFLLMPILIGAMFFCVSCQQGTPITYPPGGYDYPAKDSVTDTNFYYYPLKHVFTRYDSFWNAYDYVVYRAFNEPNLSIKPGKDDVFRFRFAGGYRDTSVVITFTKNEMTVKKGTKGGQRYVSFPNNSRLNEQEKRNFHILSKRFPLEQMVYGESSQLKKYDDSMIKLYPQLLDVNYYKYLLDKASGNTAKPYEYTEKKFRLSSNDFKRLVSIINDSGYWQMPYRVECDNDFWDGYGFSLEASTKNKYNYVGSYICNEDKTKFLAICQAIINYAGLEKQIDLLWFTKPKKPEETKPVKVFIQDVTLADVKEDSTNLPPKKKQKK